MANAYAKATGKFTLVSVHSGPGLTNAITGIGEAAKSRTPLLVLAGDVPTGNVKSNFYIEQADLVRSVGAVSERIYTTVRMIADREPVRSWVGEGALGVFLIDAKIDPNIQADWHAEHFPRNSTLFLRATKLVKSFKYRYFILVIFRGLRHPCGLTTNAGAGACVRQFLAAARAGSISQFQ